MKNIVALVLIIFFAACSTKEFQSKDDFDIATGQMPAMAKDKENHIHLVYGKGDSIMYAYSVDNIFSFSTPSLIATIPHVYTFAMRGPQIAATSNGIVVTACTSSGNIYSFLKDHSGNWIKGNKVNDADSSAKEGLMALSADHNNAFALWLDIRGNNRNKIYGAKSVDGGKTWLKNIMIYSSPDSTVCECCKPSVIIKGEHIYVMFRNWLQGNRDLYLAQSDDGGNSFMPAEKLGIGSWKLNGCPMDGGNLTINEKGEVQTVWRKENKVFSASPGTVEKEIGNGRDCTIETVNNKNVYAWVEDGKVVVLTPQGQKKFIGKGSLPSLKTLDDKHILCVWQNETQLHAAVLQL